MPSEATKTTDSTTEGSIFYKRKCRILRMQWTWHVNPNSTEFIWKTCNIAFDRMKHASSPDDITLLRHHMTSPDDVIPRSVTSPLWWHHVDVMTPGSASWNIPHSTSPAPSQWSGQAYIFHLWERCHKKCQQTSPLRKNVHKCQRACAHHTSLITSVAPSLQTVAQQCLQRNKLVNGIFLYCTRSHARS